MSLALILLAVLNTWKWPGKRWRRKGANINDLASYDKETLYNQGIRCDYYVAWLLGTGNTVENTNHSWGSQINIQLMYQENGWKTLSSRRLLFKWAMKGPESDKSGWREGSYAGRFRSVTEPLAEPVKSNYKLRQNDKGRWKANGLLTWISIPVCFRNKRF